MTWQLPIGAQLAREGVRFRVWAPDVSNVEVVVFGESDKEVAAHALKRCKDGYHEGTVEGLRAGTRYMYRIDGDKERPDPASRHQPEGVHGPSEIVSASFEWTDRTWKGIPLDQIVLYEVHIGTATTEGTFEAFIQTLPYLKSLGVTAIEIMPVADFPGDRNWGYDGVCLYAPARAYGGAAQLKKLVNAAHEAGLAVIQDVVYNHLGPDGNYLRDFSRDYFTDKKKTPWGDAVNYAVPQVRDFFITNALYWAHEYHMDGLRLDATHAILDDSNEHLLKELNARVKESLPRDRHFVIMAEDERNEVWLITPAEEGGAGLDAVWADDFHHQVRSAVAGDNEGYYANYTGSPEDIVRTLNQGWFYTGQLYKGRGKRRGTDASHIDPEHFVYCIQNHDQIGNRAFGDRLTESVGPDAYRAASALLLLSPYTPLLFQGQEWAASTPFLFFTDHNPELGKLITRGRREEFSHFKSFKGAEIPDPQAESTFKQSKLKWSEIEEDEHKQVLELYRALLQLRGSLVAFKERSREDFRGEHVGENAIAMLYLAPPGKHDLLVVVNLGGNLRLNLAAMDVTQPPQGYRWEAVLSTEEPRFGGSSALEDTQSALTDGQLRVNGPAAVALKAVRQ